MSTPLSTFLSDKPGALMIYPPSLDISFVLSDFHSNQRLSLQDKKPLFMVSPHVNLPSLLPRVSYESLSPTLLDKTILFVDDISLFLLTAFSLPPNSFPPSLSSTILFFVTLGISEQQLSQLSTILPGLPHIYLSYLPNRIQLGYALILTHMTPTQSQTFDLERQNELYFANSSLPHQYAANTYLKSMKIGNYLYPFPSTSVDTTFPPDDVKNNGGWVTPDSPLSPKIARLLQLVKETPGRHVIYSRYNERYGVQLLSAFLTLHDIPHILFLNDDITMLHRFNQENYKVLLLNAAPPLPIWNVSSIHFLEGYTLDTFNSLLSNIFRDNNYPRGKHLIVIYSHIASKADGNNAADISYYLPFAQKIEALAQTYTTLVVNSRFLTSNNHL